MIQCILFDWGDTIMQVLGYDGPMATWPRVENVPGVEAALAALHRHYRLALATNAADSGRDLVSQALARGDLDNYLDLIVTAHELGARKPEPAFYVAVLRDLGCTPENAAMVGDDYQADVIGAKRAGLKAIWFNPAGRACPVAQPVHDAEVRAMADLAATVSGL